MRSALPLGVPGPWAYLHMQRRAFALAGDSGVKWVTIKKAAELSGYSERAIEACTANGFLNFGLHWTFDPTGRRMINWEELREIESPLQVHLPYSEHIRRRHARPNWVDSKDIDLIYQRAKAMTELTGVPQHVDHIIPIMHRLVCGLDVPNNLAVIPAKENLRKSNRWEAA